MDKSKFSYWIVGFLKLLIFKIRPCHKHGHYWKNWCYSGDLVTGRKCVKCNEIELIDFSFKRWFPQRRCKICDSFCALKKESFCAECKKKIEVE